MNEIPYGDFVKEKINSIVLNNKNILSHNVNYEENANTINITLIYRDFNVLMKYGENITEGYSFIENTNLGKALITKFEFSFSQIPYSIYDVHNAVSDHVFNTYDFHCLYNENAVDRAFDTVIAFINRNEKIISSINDNAKLRNTLESSFEQGLKAASKKITLDKISEDSEKYLLKHDIDLYFLRFGETAFTEFINKNNTRAIQKFYTKHHKKDNLLTYEERYLEHLYENDFNITNEDFAEEVNNREKTSKHIDRKESITIIISLIISLALNILLGIITEQRLEENYFLLKDVTLENIIPIIISMIAMTAVLKAPVDFILSKKRKDGISSFTKDDKKVYVSAALVGIVVFALTNAFVYLDYQKNVGLGENDIYYCQSIGKAETLTYDKVKLYLIEGEYYGDEYSSTEDDKQIVVVKGDDYDNYFVSDYLTYIEMPRTYRDSLNYAGKYKSLDDFCEEFGV